MCTNNRLGKEIEEVTDENRFLRDWIHDITHQEVDVNGCCKRRAIDLSGVDFQGGFPPLA